MRFFDAIGASYGLTLAQVIKGYGAQKELTYSYNMQYDEATNKDIVTGTTLDRWDFGVLEWAIALQHSV